MCKLVALSGRMRKRVTTLCVSLLRVLGYAPGSTKPHTHACTSLAGPHSAIPVTDVVLFWMLVLAALMNSSQAIWISQLTDEACPDNNRVEHVATL